MLPHKLKNFRTYVDGDNYAGIAKDLALPKIAVAGEDYRGAGMLGPIMIDMGIDKLEQEETYGGIVPRIVSQLGNTAADGSMARFVGAYQSDENGSVKAAELVVRGRLVEIDPGTAEAGQETSAGADVETDQQVRVEPGAEVDPRHRPKQQERDRYPLGKFHQPVDLALLKHATQG